MHTHRGFTLLELIVSIVIVAILASISIPYIHDIVIEQRRTVEQKRLTAALNYARSMAITQGEFVTLCPSSDKIHCVANWQQPLMIFIDRHVKAAVDAHDYLLRRVNALNYGHLTLKAFPTKRYFRFHPNGFTDNQNGTFQYCYRGKGWRLIINRAGRLRQEKIIECVSPN